MTSRFLSLLGISLICCSPAPATASSEPLAAISAAIFESECIRDSPARQLILHNQSGKLLFRQKKEKFLALLPCQWFIDATAFGTNILLNISHVAGACGLESCVVVFDGDSLDDVPLAALGGSVTRDAVVVISSSPKIFVQIAAGCNDLKSFLATFQVLNCSGCSGNFSQDDLDSGMQVGCPARCPQSSRSGMTMEVSEDPELKCITAFLYGSNEKCPEEARSEDEVDVWRVINKNGSRRAGHSAVLFNNSMWIFGGYNFSSTSDILDRFSLTDLQWTPATINDSFSKPVGRYLHTGTLFNNASEMLIYGGFDSRGSALSDFWSFSFSSSSWTKLPNDFLPGLAAHSSTEVGDKLYLFGGYMQHGSLSSAMFVWSSSAAQWSAERPKNGDNMVARMAGHSTVYYAQLESLIVFGGIRASAMGVQLLYLYNLKEQIWISITPQFPPNTLAPFAQLVFHRAEVVGNYMVISGGYDAGKYDGHVNSRSCRQSSVYFYHLDCHVFLSRNLMDKQNLTLPDLNRFGHSTVIWKNNQLISYGGLADLMLNEMGSFLLPEFIVSSGDHCVKDYTDRTACQADLSCVWCAKSVESDDEGLCVGQRNAQIICGAAVNPTCPGLCPTLSACTSCLAFRQENHCSWCSQAMKCVSSNLNSRETCVEKRQKEIVGWWTNKVISVDSVDNCQQPQTTSGLTVTVFQPDPDFLMPDEVNLVQTSVLSLHPIVRFPSNHDTGTLIVEMKGFLHPLGANPKSSWDTQLRMWARTGNSLGFDGIAQLWLSRDSDPRHVELVAESRGIFPIKMEANRHDASPLFPAADDKYFVKFVYQVSVVRGRLTADFDVHLFLTWNGYSIVTQPFDARNLEPYSSGGSSCSKLTSCLQCLQDLSCGWCWTTKQCLMRPTDPTSYASCLRPDGTAMLMNVDFGQCIDCAIVDESNSCNQQLHCQWDMVAHGCYRKGQVSLERRSSPDADCAKLTSCSPCVQSSEKCVWCHSTGQCLPQSALSVVSAFGQCRFWENGDVSDPCTDCKEIRECDACLSRPSCGWCSKVGKDPRQGVCLNGNSVGLNATEDSVCPRNGNLNGSLPNVWSYSTCPDVDECMLGLADCHPNATCTNTRGFYKCDCSPGFKGDGRMTCIKTCNDECVNGKCSDVIMPTLEPFKCICDLGWTGSRCDVDCGCNFHATCARNVSQCDQCFGNTEGTFCEKCVRGTFGNATVDKGCLPCSCNGHADPSQPCDSITGRCHCEYPYFGRNCEKCPAEFYGDPLNGGICYHKCRSRTLIINATSGGLGNENDSPDGFCLWILVSGKEDYFGDKLSITLTIDPSMEVYCPNNSIIVNNGLPNWLVAPDISTDLSPDDAKLFDLFENLYRPSTILSSTCGPLRKPMVLTAESGIMTVLMWKSSRSEKFNATYAVEDAYYSSSAAATSRRKKRALGLVRLSSRVGHTVRVMKNVGYLFGGLDPLRGVSNDLWFISNETMASTGWTMMEDHTGIRPLPRYFHASCVVGDSMVIQGGFVENADRVLVGSDMWLFNATTRVWRELLIVNSVKLAGHTMTVVKDVIYIIGGAAETFSDLVFTYKISEQQWRIFPANGSRPPGLYGHTATYYQNRNAVFVYGGYRFDVDRSGMSSLMSVLDLNRRRWILMPSMMQENPLSPRMFHAAKYVREANYMIIAGGRTPGDIFDQSLLIYRFRCNDWLDESSPNITTLLRPSFMRFANESDTVVYLVSGFAYTQPFINFTRMPVIQDFCPRYATTGQCLSTLGCGMCFSDTGNGSFCFDNSGGSIVSCGSKNNMYPGTPCDDNLSVMRICREQRECRTCVAPWIGLGEEESRCQWCTNCGNGLCIARYETCESSLSCNRSNAVCRDPGACLDERCHAADCSKCVDLRSSCFWTRHFQRSSETVRKFRKTPLFPWNCFPQELFQKIAPAIESMNAAPPGECPVPCNRFETCSDCLGAEGGAGGSFQCVWSDDKAECMNPSIVQLRCPLGNCGVLLYGGSGDRCPKDPKSVQVCRECLKSGRTGWCALDETNGMGVCMAGGVSGPILGTCATSNNVTRPAAITTLELDSMKGNSKIVPPLSSLPDDMMRHTWHFLTCPPENECLNGHHTCESKSEDCQDTLLGFNCSCKTGYATVPVAALDSDDRNFKCTPICVQGCKQGRCVEPEVCKCDFGFVGSNCSIACQCNGHSECPSEYALTTCTKCTNSTHGAHCDKCQEGFVGDARNGGRCQSCYSYCNNHANFCLTINQVFNGSSSPLLPDNPFQNFDVLQLKTILDRDPASNMALCYNCDGNTTGYRCDLCNSGYFRPPPYSTPKDPCRACECNGHDNTCNALSGTNCKCANNTATDPVCDGTDKKDLPNGVPCWTVQCAQCKEYFVGRPTGGHQCYRQMSVGEDYCFDPEIPRGRCATADGSNALRQGRTVFFAVQPKYLNVDIRIYIDVTGGGIDFYISDQEDMFVVTVDKKSGFHNVQVDRKYMAFSRGIDDVVDFHRAADVITYVSASDQGKVVIIRDVRHRLILSIPYTGHDLKQSKFYVVIHGIGSPTSDLTRGRILFRQDQPHIDLFVFFSVFFSCFFLFLAVCILLWKFKHVYGVRQNRQRVAIELQTMASRPFALIHVVFEKKVTEPSAVTVIDTEAIPAAEIADASTSAGMRRMATRIRKKKRNVVDPGDGTTSPRSSLVAIPVATKTPKLMPLALEYLQGGVMAVATLPIELPGGTEYHSRFCLATTLVSAPQFFNQAGAKNG